MAKGTLGKTPAKGTFILGSTGEKTPLGGKISKGNDLRQNAGKNAGKMPKSM